MIKKILSLGMKSQKAHYLFFAKLLSALSALLMIPVTLEVTGRELWLKIATIQSLAVMLTPIIQMHWTKYGGITLLQNHEGSHNKLLKTSILSKLIVLFAINCSMGIYFFFYQSKLDQALLMGAFFYTSSTNLSNDWFFLAKSRFKTYFLLESIPRFIFLFVPLLFIDSKGEITFLFFFLAVINIVTSLLALRKNCNRGGFILDSYSKSQKIRLVFLQFISFGILFSPVPIVNFFDFEDKFSFTVLERFLRIFMAAILPISQVAHAQLIGYSSGIDISRMWIKRMYGISALISLIYFPTMTIYLLLIDLFEIFVTDTFLIGMIGILIILTFSNRIHEEIFVLKIKNMGLYNAFQLMGIGLMIGAFLISLLFRTSVAIAISLILVEMCRFLFMRKSLNSRGLLS